MRDPYRGRARDAAAGSPWPRSRASWASRSGRSRARASPRDGSAAPRRSAAARSASPTRARHWTRRSSTRSTARSRSTCGWRSMPTAASSPSGRASGWCRTAGAALPGLCPRRWSPARSPPPRSPAWRRCSSTTSPNFRRHRPRPGLVEAGVRSVAAAPLRDTGGPFGTVGVTARRPRIHRTGGPVAAGGREGARLGARADSAAEQRVRHEALHDPLTGLPNRAPARRPPRAGDRAPRPAPTRWPSWSPTWTASRA